MKAKLIKKNLNNKWQMKIKTTINIRIQSLPRVNLLIYNEAFLMNYKIKIKQNLILMINFGTSLRKENLNPKDQMFLQKEMPVKI